MSINRVNISGNLTRDPEARGGGNVLAFGVAVNDRRKNPDTDEWEDVPNFIDCVVFGRRAAALEQILRKGMKVAVEGKLRQSRWETDDGQTRSRIEVVVDEVEFMSARGEGDGGGRRRRPTNASGYPTQAASPYETPAPQGQVVAPGVYQPSLQQPQPQQPAQSAYDSDIPF